MSYLTKKCEICGIEFRTKKSHYERRKTCSKSCYAKLQSINNSGKGNPNYRGGNDIYTCFICGKEISASKSIHKVKKCCSKECTSKMMSIRYTGFNNPAWRGGISCYGDIWPYQRELARERDNNICQICGATSNENGKRLDVHHIKPFKIFSNPIEANNLSNLITLCRKCHRKEERKAQRFYGITINTNSTIAPENYLTPDQFAEIAKINRNYVYFLIRKGIIKATNVRNVPNRIRPRYVISKEEVNHFLS